MLAFSFTPIGVVRSPFVARVDAPRQASVAKGTTGSIELEPGRGFEDALAGLDGWDFAWVLFVFHQNVADGRGWRPKVLPPRASAKVGVFATRSPHRPNPLGLSAVRIDSVEGLVVKVRGLDLLDGTPVLDLKPYVPYADAHPDARSGWLQVQDPGARWAVEFTSTALAELAWLDEHGVALRSRIEATLALGPQPHAYRRIRAHAGGLRMALKEWRVDFAVSGATITVQGLRTGYRPRQLATEEGLGIHREFVAAFGT